jgi:hypothetical protein
MSSSHRSMLPSPPPLRLEVVGVLVSRAFTVEVVEFVAAPPPPPLRLEVVGVLVSRAFTVEVVEFVASPTPPPLRLEVVVVNGGVVGRGVGDDVVGRSVVDGVGDGVGLGEIRAQRVPGNIEQEHDTFMHADVSQQFSLRLQAVLLPRPAGKEGVPSNELLLTSNFVNAVSVLRSRLPVNALSCNCSSCSDGGKAGAGPTNPDC